MVMSWLGKAVILIAIIIIVIKNWKVSLLILGIYALYLIIRECMLMYQEYEKGEL